MAREKKQPRKAKAPINGRKLASVLEPPRGVCQVCLCTDDDAEVCCGICDWTDKTHSLCTSCVELTPSQQVVKRRDAINLLVFAIGELQDEIEERLQLIVLRLAVAGRFPVGAHP